MFCSGLVWIFLCWLSLTDLPLLWVTCCFTHCLLPRVIVSLLKDQFRMIFFPYRYCEKGLIHFVLQNVSTCFLLTPEMADCCCPVSAPALPHSCEPLQSLLTYLVQHSPICILFTVVIVNSWDFGMRQAGV